MQNIKNIQNIIEITMILVDFNYIISNKMIISKIIYSLFWRYNNIIPIWSNVYKNFYTIDNLEKHLIWYESLCQWHGSGDIKDDHAFFTQVTTLPPCPLNKKE